MTNATTVTTFTGRQVRCGAVPTGVNFGWVGVVKARNGRVVHATTDVYPFAERAAEVAARDAQSL